MLEITFAHRLQNYTIIARMHYAHSASFSAGILGQGGWGQAASDNVRHQHLRQQQQVMVLCRSGSISQPTIHGRVIPCTYCIYAPICAPTLACNMLANGIHPFL